MSREYPEDVWRPVAPPPGPAAPADSAVQRPLDTSALCLVGLD